MPLNSSESLVPGLSSSLKKFGFRFYPGEELPEALKSRGIWTRRTWNTNRAVVLLDFQGEGDPKLFIKRMRWRLLKKIGFFPVFYPLGLQLILWGSNYLKNLGNRKGFVDAVDNQLVLGSVVN